MKKQLVLGSIAAVLLVALVPAIPAVEFTSAVDAQKTRLITEMETLDVKDVVNYLQRISVHEIRSHWLTVDREEITDALSSLDISKAIQDIEDELAKENAQPQCIRLTLFLFKLLCRFVGFIIKVIVGTIGRTIGFFFRIVGTIIGLIFGVLGRIVGLIFGTLGLIFGIMGRIIRFFGKILGFILDLIFPGIVHTVTA